MKKYGYLFLFLLIGFVQPLSAQYQIKSAYLKNPDLVLGYVDSCAKFWMPVWDNANNGFWTNVDRQGNLISAWGTNKDMISQSRNAYGLIRAFQMTGNETYLDRAKQSLNFMYLKSWDQTSGGWHNSLNNLGNPSNVNANKTAFYQHYALLGIMASLEATQDTNDWKWMKKGYDFNESKLWDSNANSLGYFDQINRAGSTKIGKTFNSTVDAITTHLLNLYLMTGEEKYKTRMLQVAANMTDKLAPTVDQNVIGFAENYNTDWTYNNSTSNDNTRTIMGHVLKTAWCLGRIYQLVPTENYLTVAKKLADHVWEKGYDHVYGGPYKDYDRVTGTMLLYGQIDSAKAWWQMEQAVTGGMMLYDITQDEKYLQMADESLDFFMTNFVDHTYGEVYENQKRRGGYIWNDAKAGGGKAGYHSIETGYYVYLYGNLMLKKKPVTLHYRFDSAPMERIINMNPLEVADNRYIISSVLKDGNTYSDYISSTRKLTLPAGVSGHFTVTYDINNISSVAEQNTKLEELNLNQNYPNPFNPVTAISYQLPATSNIKLVVYDLLGREIKTLVNQTQTAGIHQVDFDASSLPSGIYLYRLQSGSKSVTKKMTVMK